MSSRSVFRGVFWGLISLLLVVHVGGGWYYSSRIIDDGFTPNPDPIVIPEGDFELTEVVYESELGEMDAWHLPASGTTWVIHVHGLNGTPAEPEVLFAPLQGAGYPQLAITYRNDENQPRDPSGYFQYGATEWEDLSGAVEYARANGAAEIILAGYSSGASHALSYVFRHNFDDLGGLILDSANIDLGSTVDYRGSIEKLPGLPMNVPPTISWAAKFFTSLRIDVNWKALDYIDKAERSLRVPVLAIHGVEDDSIPIAQSVALAEAQPDLVQLVQVEGAGHVDSFNTDFDGYLSAVLTFLDEVG
ncbi:MAG: alpha/beta hydrolase [Acidimicrobiia bacterium]